MQEIIIIPGTQLTAPTSTGQAREERDALLVMAKNVENIRDLVTAEKAATALRSLKEFTRLIEDSRATVKAPVLDLGKKIDGLARELTSELEAEATRLSRALGAWNAEQKRLQEEAERKAREEEQRIWREAQEKERLERERLAKIEEARQAELRKKEQELAAKAIRARTEAGRKKAEEEAEALRIQAAIDEENRKAEAAEAERERNEAAGRQMVAARVQGSAVVAQKPSGVATRTEIIIEISDIHAVYRANPLFVNLSPNLTVIKSALSGNPALVIPGLTWRKEAKTHVR